MVATTYEHITLTDEHIPMLSGTTIKVIELVAEHLAYGWSPAEIHFQHPHLTLGQIHSALAYYWDHQAELDEELERRWKQVEHLRSSAPTAALGARLRASGQLQ